MLLACPGEAGNQIRKLSTCATVSKGDFHVDSNSLAALDRRCLRRAGPGHYRIFTRRMSGFDCAGVYRRTVGLLDRRLFPSSGTLIIPVGGMRFPVIWSVIGAALFVALINLISRPRV